MGTEKFLKRMIAKGAEKYFWSDLFSIKEQKRLI